MNALEKQEKPVKKTVRRVVDFPEERTNDIFAFRWHNTSYMMSLRYYDQSIYYGETKVRYEFTVEGNTDKIKEFFKFVDNTLDLVSDEDWPDASLGVKKEDDDKA